MRATTDRSYPLLNRQKNSDLHSFSLLIDVKHTFIGRHHGRPPDVRTNLDAKRLQLNDDGLLACL
jgi:hypothetical protein